MSHTAVKKIVAGTTRVVIGSLLALLTFGVLSTVSLMNTAHDCPVMGGGDGMCPMTISDHISWFSNLFGTLPTILSLVFVALVIRASAALLLLDFGSSVIPHRTDQAPPPFISLLFSSGILHPRLFPVRISA